MSATRAKAEAKRSGAGATLDGEWVGLVVAARELGENRQSVLVRAIKGDLEAKHVAGRTIVSRASLDRVLATKQGAKAP